MSNLAYSPLQKRFTFPSLMPIRPVFGDIGHKRNKPRLINSPQLGIDHSMAEQKVDNNAPFLSASRFCGLVFELSHQSLFWVQALGFVSMAIGWWANAQKSDQQLLSGNLIASGLTAIHLGLLGSNLGLFNQLLNMLRFAICRKRVTRAKRSSIYLPLVFASLAFLQGLMWANHWTEWCAVASAVLMSFALFYAKGSELRIAMLMSNLLNLTLSVYLLSWSGIAYQVITIVILSYSLIPVKTLNHSTKPAC